METKTQETNLTDLEAFVQLYSRVGINVKIDIREDDEEKIIDLNDDNKHEKFGGYAGCFSEIVFDMEGNFLRQDFWEF